MDANLNMVLDQVSKDKGIERSVLIAQYARFLKSFA
jgi:hypothetical protein